MICVRCLRASARLPSTVTRSPQQLSALTRNVQRRQLSVLSSVPTRPNLLATRPFDGDVPTSAVNTSLSSGMTAIQMRGAKRDTFKPSHRVRKRRHGFLARLRSRTGRMILKRRQAKGRHNLSH